MPPSNYQEVTVSCETAGMKVHPTEVEYSSIHDKGAAGYIVKGLTKGAIPPERGAGTQLKINDEPICGGPVHVSDVDDENVVTFEVFDAKRTLNIERISGIFGNPGESDTPSAGQESGGNPFLVAENLFETAGVKHDINGDREANDIPEGSLNAASPAFGFEVDDIPVSKALNKLSQQTGGIWHVDGTNTCHFRLGPPFENYRLRRVLEFEEGEQSFPWGAVKVISRPSWRNTGEKCVISNKPLVGWFPKQKKNRKKPFYKYKTNDIHSKAVAEQVAKGTYRSFQKQRGTGKAKIVGDARIRPGDTVNLSNIFEREHYAVKSVTHSVNSTEGFVTELDFNMYIP